ncbi:response regulator [bacterium]
MESQGKKKLLIVEDDTDILNLLFETFSNNTFICTGVAKGQTAIEIFDKQNFDLVIMDFELPDMNGYELYRMIRKTEKIIPIIFNSSHSNHVMLKEFPLNFADVNLKFVKKSASSTRLTRTVRKFLSIESTSFGEGKTNNNE